MRAEQGQRVRADAAAVELRRVVVDDWPAVRALRLEALQDAPVAYCETYAAAVAEPDETWRERAARGAEGGDGFEVLAWLRDVPVAMSVGFLEGGDAGLAAVYVTPACRGWGLLDRMVEQVAAWAQQQGAPQLRLLVHESNAPARRAYERLGFRATGHREPYPLDPTTQEVELALALPAGVEAAPPIG